MSEKEEKSSGEAQGRKENLTPWKPGQSGNPAGKKKGCKNVATRAKELLEAVSKGEGYADPIARAVIEILEGDGKPNDRLKAAEFLRDAIDGKVAQQIDNISSDGSMSAAPQKIELIGKNDDSSDTTTPKAD